MVHKCDDTYLSTSLTVSRFCVSLDCCPLLFSFLFVAFVDVIAIVSIVCLLFVCVFLFSFFSSSSFFSYCLINFICNQHADSTIRVENDREKEKENESGKERRKIDKRM